MNPGCLPDSFHEYVLNDNLTTKKIYDDLVFYFNESLKIYPKEESVFAIYFFEILKFITLIKLKEREIKNKVFLSDQAVIRTQVNWPYIGHQDLITGHVDESKNFGKNILISQSRKKRLAQGIHNLRSFFIPSGKYTASVISPNIDTKTNLWLDSPSLRTNLISNSNNFFYFSDFKDQLNLIISSLKLIFDKNSFPLRHKSFLDLISNHIQANCKDGKERMSFETDIIILKSGIELHNRFISRIAHKNKIPVLNIMHGESFGVLDEPVFSKYGECMYSNLVLGYGDQVVKSQIPYSHTYSNKKSYIPSSAVLTAGLYSGLYYGLAKKNNVKYFYFPNTLSGATYRYGPYRDTADKLYLLWQRKLIELFGNDLTIKTHPKEMYKSLLIFDNQKVLNSSFMDVKDLVDVYIFDHIGTAFNLACSTNKPVIYFHLGIRNIHNDALKEIKKRTIFIDVRDGIPGISEIRQRLNFDNRKNCYTKKYSFGGVSGLSRSESLYTALENYLNST